MIECDDVTDRILSPLWVNRIRSVNTQAKFVLVIEKDAVFTKLLGSSALQKLGPCVLLTVKTLQFSFPSNA